MPNMTETQALERIWATSHDAELLELLRLVHNMRRLQVLARHRGHSHYLDRLEAESATDELTRNLTAKLAAWLADPTKGLAGLIEEVQRRVDAGPEKKAEDKQWHLVSTVISSHHDGGGRVVHHLSDGWASNEVKHRNELEDRTSCRWCP